MMLFSTLRTIQLIACFAVCLAPSVRPELVGNEKRSHLDLKSGINTLRTRPGEIGLSVP